MSSDQAPVKVRRRSVATAPRVRCTITLPADVGARLSELAERYGVSRATLCTDAVERGLTATTEALRRSSA